MIHVYAISFALGLLTGLPFAHAEPAAACGAGPKAAAATLSDIQRFISSKQMKVVTFAGYSGAEYEDREAMLAHAGKALSRFDPAKTLVNASATAQGIGAVYGLAKGKGFQTMGIVSLLAREKNVPLSPCVDFVFFVRDTTWGGRLPGSTQLSPTSAAIVANSPVIVGIGGGEIARDEMIAARAAGRSVSFIPADMNHQIARDKARQRGAPEPVDFRGAADNRYAK